MKNCKKLLILGNGNVSIDIAWLLTRDKNELKEFFDGKILNFF